MTTESPSHLLGQLDTAWQLAAYHLTDLSTEECVWRPARHGLHVHRGVDGTWSGELPDRERYDLGPPSIAWLTWHIGQWWSMVIDHSFGGGQLRTDQVKWPGTAQAVQEWIGGLHRQRRQAVTLLEEPDFGSCARTKWPFQDRPFGHLVAWVNLELTKSAAEIGYARFLYAVWST